MMWWERIEDSHAYILSRFGVFKSFGNKVTFNYNTQGQQVAQACQLYIYARDVDPEFGGSEEESKIALFTRTFSLSPYTTFDTILRHACNYWGLILAEFSIFQLDDDTGKPINLKDEPDRVLKFLETYSQTSTNNKDDGGDEADRNKEAGHNAKFYIGRMVT